MDDSQANNDYLADRLRSHAEERRRRRASRSRTTKAARRLARRSSLSTHVQTENLVRLLEERVEKIRVDVGNLPEFVVTGSYIQLGRMALYYTFDQPVVNHPTNELVLSLGLAPLKQVMFGANPNLQYTSCKPSRPQTVARSSGEVNWDNSIALSSQNSRSKCSLNTIAARRRNSESSVPRRRESHYNRNEKNAICQLALRKMCCKIRLVPVRREAREKRHCRRPEVGIVDDTKPEIGLAPEFKSDESLSESNRAELIVPVAGSVESTPTRAIPTNGSSPLRIAANRSNAKKSTGPRTLRRAKSISSWNRADGTAYFPRNLPMIYGQGKKQFTRLLASLQQDLEPVGTLEEVLVEKIAQEYWRLGTAAWHEAEALTKENPFTKISIAGSLRYQTTINRQLFQAMNQLERQQRIRPG